MALNRQVPQEEWADYFVTFSNGNRGRTFSIEVFDSQSGSTGQHRQGSLMAVDYDPEGRGNDIVVTAGKEEIEYSHTVKGPVEVWQEQADDGQVAAIAIVDQSQGKTVVSFS